jgi:hypothetical protein
MALKVVMEKKSFAKGAEKLENKIFNLTLQVRKEYRLQCIWQGG